MSMGALGDSFFEYLLKEWLRSGREDQEARQMYDEAMQAIMTHMLRTSAGGLMYFSDLKFDRLEHKMDHLACFSGARALASTRNQCREGVCKNWRAISTIKILIINIADTSLLCVYRLLIDSRNNQR
ncbi:hypothetical protein J6590_010974 [Homalodisca vitripennis]|nr:hypothetical protein J6590_010974 [Homalodisca vitripennis]